MARQCCTRAAAAAAAAAASGRRNGYESENLSQSVQEAKVCMRNFKNLNFKKVQTRADSEFYLGIFRSLDVRTRKLSPSLPTAFVVLTVLPTARYKCLHKRF